MCQPRSDLRNRHSPSREPEALGKNQAPESVPLGPGAQPCRLHPEQLLWAWGTLGKPVVLYWASESVQNQNPELSRTHNFFTPSWLDYSFSKISISPCPRPGLIPTPRVTTVPLQP